MGANRGQYRGRAGLGGGGQHPGDVRGALHEPADGSDPVAAGDPDRGGRRLTPVHRFRGRRRPDGSGARHLHLFRAPEVDPGDCARVFRQYLGASVDQ